MRSPTLIISLLLLVSLAFGDVRIVPHRRKHFQPVAAGGGSYALVAHTGKRCAPGAPGTVTTDAIATTGANLLIVSAAWYPGSTSEPTLSDSAGNTWTPLTVQTAGNISSRLYYSYGGTMSGAHTFTFAGADIYASIQVAAFSGASASPFDVENGDIATSASSLATGSVTPSQANTLVVAGLGHENNSGGTVTIDSSFTITDAVAWSGDGIGGALAYKFVTSGAQNPTWNAVGSTTLRATIAVFK